VRDPLERVEKAAPFLKVDGDPYPAVIGGKVTWILDGYTTSDKYPYAELTSLGEVATDALTGQGTTALPDEQVNYIRNSVKATVDAQDGTVTLYQWDEEDPVLRTFMKAFPGTVKAKSDMSEELRSHVRYPEDFFKVQRQILTRYHVDDPGDFYNQNDRWQVSADPTQGNQGSQDQPTYYILAERPTEKGASFQLTSALNAFDRENLSAFVSASSDPGNYGDIQVLRLPGNTPFQGPRQVQQSFNTNDDIARDLNLFRGSDSQPVFGNLLTLPIGRNGLLYVEPLYVEGTGDTSFPLLRKVLVNYSGRVGYADTLREALDEVFGAGAGNAAGDGSGSTETPPTTTPSESPSASESATASPSAPSGNGGQTRDEAVAALDDALAELQDAQKSGDFAAQGKALEDLQTAVEAYRKLQEGGG
jgi:uncharacterized protein